MTEQAYVTDRESHCLCMCVCFKYLVSPPHHQVGEKSNPRDGTKESDREEPFCALKNNNKNLIYLINHSINV